MKNEYKIELLQKIGEIFMKYGVRSLNMDDISKHLSISKKTLYKYFKDKNDIVLQVTTSFCEGEKCMISGFCEVSENAIDEIVRISEFINLTLQNLNPSLMFDLQKYYPESNKIFTNHKKDFIIEGIKQNIIRGMKEELYRDNLNPEIVAQIYGSKMDTIWDNDVFPITKYSFAQIHLEMIRYHIRGIASEKGIAYLSSVCTKTQQY